MHLHVQMMRCQADLRAARGEIERLNNVVRQVILMSPPISLTLRAVPDVMQTNTSIVTISVYERT